MLFLISVFLCFNGTTAFLKLLFSYFKYKILQDAHLFVLNNPPIVIQTRKYTVVKWTVASNKQKYL